MPWTKPMSGVFKFIKEGVTVATVRRKRINGKWFVFINGKRVDGEFKTAELAKETAGLMIQS